MAATTTIEDRCPPVAKREAPAASHTDEQDVYSWLRQDGKVTRQEILDYLQEENAYTEHMTSDIQPFQEKLFQEFRARTVEDDATPPVKDGPYLYYSRLVKDSQYKIYCRKPFGVADAAEEVLLDVNKLAVDGGFEFIAVGQVDHSPDHGKLLYSTDTTGDEEYTIFVKDLATGELLPETIGGAGTDLEWANDSRTFFYTLLDAQHQPNRVLAHVLGSDPATDRLFYTEHDQEYYLYLSKTRSSKYLLIGASASEESEIWIVDADAPAVEGLRVVQQRTPGLLYSVSHHPNPYDGVAAAQSTLFILTNAGDAVDFQVMTCSVDETSLQHWQPLIAHRPARRILEATAFASHLVLSVREDAILQIVLVPLPLPLPSSSSSSSSSSTSSSSLEEEEKALKIEHVKWPCALYTVGLGSNVEFDAEWLRVLFVTPISPREHVELKFASPDERRVLKVEEVPCGHDPSKYEAQRLWVESSTDAGVRIPVSVIRRRKTSSGDGDDKEQPGPLILYGYGSYEISIDPMFDRRLISYLDRGVTYCIAHIRGGGELGRRWYETGKKLLKKNSFLDFIDVARSIIDRGMTRPDLMVAIGRSAGGLLMGGVLNMAPELFRMIVADVPFVDCLNTMLDPSIPLTVLEYQEWGNPQQPEFRQAIREYAPYENIDLSGERQQPIVLVQAGISDKRVCYWEPAKFVAKYRHLHAQQRGGVNSFAQPFQILFKVEMAGGHFSKSGRYDKLKEDAWEYAVILSQLGIRG